MYIKHKVEIIKYLENEYKNKLEELLLSMKEKIEEKTGLTFEEDKELPLDDPEDKYKLLFLVAESKVDFIYLYFSYDLQYYEIDIYNEEDIHYKVIIEECFSDFLKEKV